MFGHESFGKLYGFGVAGAALIAGALQTPVTAWAIRNVESGAWESFGRLDVGIVLLSLLLFAFPAWIRWVSWRARAASLRTAAFVGIVASREPPDGCCIGVCVE